MADNGILLTEPEAARFLQISPRTLARYRYSHKGPAFIRIGPKVRYRLVDLSVWIERNAVTPEVKK